MLKAQFTFVLTTDLSIQFLDRSNGSIQTYLWDFGFKESNIWKTSNEPNPLITFPSYGMYLIQLKITNTQSGETDIKTYELLLTETPSLNTTILGMVENLLPSGFILDNESFNENTRKWQLYLQNIMEPSITDENVFLEYKWPALANILISKLVVYDVIIKAANSTIASLAQSNTSTTQTTSVAEVADFKAPLDNDIIFAGDLILNSLLVNGIEKATGQTFTSMANFIAFLNSLGAGNFFYENNFIFTHTNPNQFTTFNFTSSEIGVVEQSFEKLNTHILPINTLTPIEGATTPKGTTKRIETGPSSAEWYDVSDLWMKIFRGSGGTSMVDMLKQDICIYSKKIGVYLPMCPRSKNTIIFEVGKSC